MGSVKHSDRVSVMVTSVRTEKAQEHVTIDYLQGTTETAVVINLICLFTFDFDLCIEISTTFIIMLMLIMSSRAVMMFILAFLLFGDVARPFPLMEQGIVLGPYILIQLLLYRRKEVKDNLS
ncbi:hypothetical protein RhiirA5_507580 [Rhizophagus irregularis]|uniref:Uncharacterized protein n=1 Tax=Rhizophagus irregularis TaxID=588596 RepID=A0A2N0NIW4_9GLOM|nr:hypothetical protein RhiirA5_507580 [Rhizophagus irregularis]